MKDIFNAAWEIMSIELVYEGFKFQIWHPLAFSFIIYTLIRILLMKKGDE